MNFDKIIDIHTHIVYGIDDGSWDLEMSLRLLEMDYEQGVRGIFCTNHSEGMTKYSNDYFRRFEKLSNLAAEKYSDLRLFHGCEILCRRDSMNEICRYIKAGIFPTMNESRYVLTEFNPISCDGIDEMGFCIRSILDAGYIPIIAHAERYRRIYDDPLRDLNRLKEDKCLVQINLYSVEQDNGDRKVLANLFLENGLVDFVGTDAHNLVYKSPQAQVGVKKIKNTYKASYVKNILYENANNLLIKK